MLRQITIAVFFAGLILSCCGCMVTDLGVSNPLPSVRRIAIAPFINLSTEPDVDLGRAALFGGGYVDRRFAQAYYAELQKTPGFEVIPVGVVDQAIAASGRSMNGPEDYLAIARAIGADAIVVGAVTDFDPYHPRLGMQVQWYAEGYAIPPAPTMPYEREWDEQNYKVPHQHHRRRSSRHGHGGSEECEPCEVSRAQSPDDDEYDFGASSLDADLAMEVGPPAPPEPRPIGDPVVPEPYESLVDEQGSPVVLPTIEPLPGSNVAGAIATELLPLYSYTRFFDGRDARLTARLRDYVELSGDTRSGGWEGYLNRSDDFIRFACHVMINEMFLLHGGESSRRTVFKVRKELFRKL